MLIGSPFRQPFEKWRGTCNLRWVFAIALTPKLVPGNSREIFYFPHTQV